jgi:hypothetical protein
MTPQEFVDQELRNINEIFESRQEIWPVVVLVKDDQRFQIPVKWNNAAHKDVIAQGIKDLVKKSEPDVVVYMGEAWMTRTESVADRMPIPGRKPERFGIVLVQIEFKSGEKFGNYAKIMRNGADAHLNRFKSIKNDLSANRFMDFYPIKTIT